METWFVFRETFFFWAFPFRSGYSGVPSSPFFHVAGSSPHSQCSRAGRTRCFSLSVLSRCRFVLTCNVAERFGQHRSTLAFFHVAGSFLTCNVTERRGQRCSLTIPNAEKRLPSPLPGHLSSARDLQTERNTCTLYHGCTPFHCGIGLRRYGLRC